MVDLNTGLPIIFHRNDFKNKFYLIKILIALNIKINIISIRTKSFLNVKLLINDRNFLNNLHLIFSKFGFKKQDYSLIDKKFFIGNWKSFKQCYD